MNQQRKIDKITALWALSEAGLGGVFHAFKMPFTGLIIAGVSVLFLTLIAKWSQGKYRAMISATIIVMIIKMLISPHTPPTAYFAVFFQGTFGFLVFYLAGVNRISISIFTIVALIESGFQKILTLSIFYGVSVWDSVDSFYEYLENNFSFLPSVSGTSFLMIVYFGIYLIGALFFIWMIIGLMKSLEENRNELIVEFDKYVFDGKKLPRKKKQGFFGRRTRLVIILLLIIAILFVFNPQMGWQKAIYVFVRSTLVILAWYLLAAPLFKYLFERFLRKQKKRFSVELEYVIGIFPSLKSIVSFCLKRDGNIDSVKKLRHFFNDVIYLTLQIEFPDHEQDNHSHRPDQER